MIGELTSFNRLKMFQPLRDEIDTEISRKNNTLIYSIQIKTLRL